RQAGDPPEHQGPGPPAGPRCRAGLAGNAVRHLLAVCGYRVSAESAGAVSVWADSRRRWVVRPPCLGACSPWLDALGGTEFRLLGLRRSGGSADSVRGCPCDGPPECPWARTYRRTASVPRMLNGGVYAGQRLYGV